MATTDTSTTVKTALVTGAGRRIGRAIATSLAAKGWRVAVHYCDSAEDAESAVSEIESAGGEAIALKADLHDRDAVMKLAEQAAAFGTVSCLVNNASVFENDDIESVTPESWDRHLGVNLMAPLLLTQAVAKSLPEGENGNIINIVDQRVWRLTPNFLSYTVSKSGLWTLTQTLAQALAPRIRVNAIGPGPVLPSPRQTDAQFAAQVRTLPLQRGPLVEEICQTIAFILETPSMTGQMIALDGGQHIAWQTPDVAGRTE
ncbi:MAG TPA: SDR family oxidoreductase [Alphaproteobacteria bacterium]|nr:SDR family oxidoreductase [Alphaproteobacteria bacterium]